MPVDWAKSATRRERFGVKKQLKRHKEKKEEEEEEKTLKRKGDLRITATGGGPVPRERREHA